MRHPAVGDIVHCASVGPDGERVCCAAVVTEAPGGAMPDQAIGLCILHPTGIFFTFAKEGDPGAACPDGYTAHPKGTWHWPA